VRTRGPYRLAWTLAALLSIAAVYGFLHEHLFREFLWYPQGRAGLVLYASVFWPPAALIVWLAPRRLGLIAAAVAIAYAAWWSGPAAPAAVLFLLGSCFLLGRTLLAKATAHSTDGITQTLVGAAVSMSVFWIALHFPINNRWVYLAVLALPYAGGFRFQTRPRAPGSRMEATALAMLLFIMGAHFLVALKPEISSDGLSMHLALPMAVLRDARWAFDVRHYAWSAMPIGGDTLYAVAYVLGSAKSGAKSGEAAARLLNFAFLVMIVVMIVRHVADQIRPRPANVAEVSSPATPAAAWLAAALFASTPLVQVVTGSLFIENVWAAFVLASALATVRYLDTGESHELAIAGFLLGAAAAVKLIAGAFLLPIAVLAVWGAVWGVIMRRQWKPLAVAAALASLAAAPPYVYAYAATGNPVFPFENQIFRSPQFDTNESFDDPRYHAPRSWKTPFDLTFRSAQFIEGQGGAAGFQYFLLLAPALLLIRKRDHAALAIIAVGAALIILAVLPNLRYLYPVLPLFSILIAGLVHVSASEGDTPALASAAFTGLIALNFWFLPASGWYDNEFALFRHAAIRPYLEKMAPARLLIDRLNHTAPGEPAAFFSTDATADLNALAYTDTWHSELYWNRVRFATTPQQIVAVMNELGVRHVIAPASRQGASAPIHDFLARWLDPESAPIGPLGTFSLRATPLAVPADTKPFGPGAYDDLIDGIEHSGGWIFDRQFAQAAHGTLTYSDTPGDFLRFQFSGSAITYIYTPTFNRGIAQVSIDGAERARVNQYSPRTLWQKSSEIRGLTAGVHTFELRVTGEKDPRSSGRFVDFDGFVVE